MKSWDTKSPLYGEITSHLEVRPFDYLEWLLFPDYSQEEKLLAYMAFSEEFPAISGHSIPLRVLRKILPDTFYRKIPISMMNPIAFTHETTGAGHIQQHP